MDLVIGFQETLQQRLRHLQNPEPWAGLPAYLGLGRSQGDLDFVANQAAVGFQNRNKLHRYFIFFHLMGYGKVSSWHSLLQ